MADRQICRQRILSEEYRDFIIQSEGSRIAFTVPEEQLCRQKTQAGYDVIYVEQVLAEQLPNQKEALLRAALELHQKEN